MKIANALITLIYLLVESYISVSARIRLGEGKHFLGAT